MPLFDIQCKGCKKISQNVVLGSSEPVPPCSECNGEQEKVWLPGGCPLGAPFRAGYYPNIDIEPVYCGSKRQLREECAKRGLFSEYAE